MVAHRLVRPSGKVNLIGLVILGAIGYGIWWVVTFSGVYLDNIDVRDAVEGAYNESGRKDDATLVMLMKNQLNLSTLGNHEETDEFGVTSEKGGLGLIDENFSVTRDEVTKRITIIIQYQRKVSLKPLKKFKMVPFRVMKEGPVPIQSS